MQPRELIRDVVELAVLPRELREDLVELRQRGVELRLEPISGYIRRDQKIEAETPGLKIAINSAPTHFFGTRYPIECQKVSYTLYIVSKSVIYALHSVKKCLIHSINCYFQSWCVSLLPFGR